MALIKMSSIGITNLSGKAGGSVYAHNRGGSYVRNFAVPSNPKTQAQAAARAAFGSFASKRRSLSQGVQEAWRAASQNFPYMDRFGEERHMSGENLYISLNRNLEVIGENEITEPPSPQGVDGVIEAPLKAHWDGSDDTIEFDGVVLAGNEAAETVYAIYMSTGMSAGISYAKNRLRFILHQDESEIIAPNDFAATYNEIFGALKVGSKIFFRIDPINSTTGERGASFFGSTVVLDTTP